MSSDADDILDDLSIVPARAVAEEVCTPALRSRNRKNGSAVALLLSLALHAAAGAALAGWAARQFGTPMLEVAWGAGVEMSSMAADADGSADAFSATDVPLPETSTDLQNVTVTDNMLVKFDAESVNQTSFGESAFSGELDPSVFGSGASKPAAFGMPSTFAGVSGMKRSPPGRMPAGGDVGVGDGSAPGPPIAHAGNRPPDYPREARQRRWEGKVMLEVRVSTTGEVVDAHIATSSGHDILDTAALQAVRAWRFTNSTGGHWPAEWLATLPVQFTLRR